MPHKAKNNPMAGTKVPRLLEVIMILDLLRNDGLEPRKAAGTNGGEYSSPCPVCGGTDRFRTWPEQDRYWCRQCEKAGDAIQYLRDIHGLSFQSAARQVGKDILPPDRQKVRAVIPEKPKKPKQPLKGWSDKAAKLVAFAHNELMGSNARMEWLQKERGLLPETAERFKLGWLDTIHYRAREAWGLEPETKENGQPKKLFIPSGLVIPCFDRDQVNRVRIRRDNPGDFGRYYVLPGSSSGPLITRQFKSWPGAVPAIIVESDLDAILLHQELNSSYAIASLGSCSMKPSGRLAEQLQGLPYLILALDADAAGRKGKQYWLENFENSVWFPMHAVYGKDPTEAFLNGLDLNLWLEAAAIEVMGMTAVK